MNKTSRTFYCHEVNNLISSQIELLQIAKYFEIYIKKKIIKYINPHNFHDYILRLFQMSAYSVHLEYNKCILSHFT